jgi:hypothetical protein
MLMIILHCPATLPDMTGYIFHSNILLWYIYVVYLCSCIFQYISIDFNIFPGWWYTYPSETYELVSWDYDIPNIWTNKTCSKPPTSIDDVHWFHSSKGWFSIAMLIYQRAPSGTLGKPNHHTFNVLVGKLRSHGDQEIGRQQKMDKFQIQWGLIYRITL